MGRTATRQDRDEIRLWRDRAIGSAGVELLAGRCFEHRYRPHFHEEAVIAAFIGGAQNHSVGRHTGVAVPGSVLIIPPGETHTGEAAEHGWWSYRAYYPDGSTLSDLAADLFSERKARHLAFDTTPLHDDPELAAHLITLHRYIEASAADPLGRQRAFAAAMAAVLIRYARPSQAVRHVHPEHRKVRRAIDYARAHYANPDLGIGDLAKAAGLSPYHFMRCFRAATGVTAHGFVVQLRVQHARQLLADGHAAAEVAHTVGFADQSHLIRHFRSRLGITPRQYATDTQERSGRAR